MPGIHHVTAISGDPVKNLRFYTRDLGLRFVKKTVNFDDPSTYHFYFGDETGHPGTIMTFFPSFVYAGAGLTLPANRKGRRPAIGREPLLPGGPFGLSSGSGSSKASAMSARAAWSDVPTSSRDSR